VTVEIVVANGKWVWLKTQAEKNSQETGYETSQEIRLKFEPFQLEVHSQHSAEPRHQSLPAVLQVHAGAMANARYTAAASWNHIPAPEARCHTIQSMSEAISWRTPSRNIRVACDELN